MYHTDIVIPFSEQTFQIEKQKQIFKIIRNSFQSILQHFSLVLVHCSEFYSQRLCLLLLLLQCLISFKKIFIQCSEFIKFNLLRIENRGTAFQSLVSFLQLSLN